MCTPWSPTHEPQPKIWRCRDPQHPSIDAYGSVDRIAPTNGGGRSEHPSVTPPPRGKLFACRRVHSRRNLRLDRRTGGKTIPSHGITWAAKTYNDRRIKYRQTKKIHSKNDGFHCIHYAFEIRKFETRTSNCTLCARPVQYHAYTQWPIEHHGEDTKPYTMPSRPISLTNRPSMFAAIDGFRQGRPVRVKHDA